MYWYPPSSSAFWYGGAALSNEALSDERDESRLLMYIYLYIYIYIYINVSRG